MFVAKRLRYSGAPRRELRRSRSFMTSGFNTSPSRN
jgi:hypothetical protein